MLYYLFQYLESSFDFPGARLFSYISFRSGVAFILALFIATIIGRRIINKLQILQIGELVRDLGLEGQMSKKGTPTMGGIIIIIAILIPCLLVGRLGNIYMILMLITTVWLGAIGFLDDYIKVFKKDKEGLHGRFKIVGQVGLGLIVGLNLHSIFRGLDCFPTYLSGLGSLLFWLCLLLPLSAGVLSISCKFCKSESSCVISGWKDKCPRKARLRWVGLSLLSLY